MYRTQGDEKQNISRVRVNTLLLGLHVYKTQGDEKQNIYQESETERAPERSCYLCYVSRALINSLVCRIYPG